MARRTKIVPGVQQPTFVGTVVGTWDWHVWRKDFHGNEWVGFFADVQTALDWCKTQQPVIYIVNNVPPSTSRTFMDRQTTPPRNPVTKPRTPEGLNPFPISRPMNVPVPVQPVKVDKDAVKLKKTAKARLEKHKADEAADVASGKIVNV